MSMFGDDKQRRKKEAKRDLTSQFEIADKSSKAFDRQNGSVLDKNSKSTDV